MYTKVHKTSLYGQGLTRKEDCFHGLLKDWTAAITASIVIYGNDGFPQLPTTLMRGAL